MREELYQSPGEVRCEELAKQNWSFWHPYELCVERKNALIGGVVRERLERDSIRDSATGPGIKAGFI